MITFKIFNLSRLLSQQVAPVLFRWGTTGKQRFSHLIWMCQQGDAEGAPDGRALPNLLFNHYGRAVIHQIE